MPNQITTIVAMIVHAIVLLPILVTISLGAQESAIRNSNQTAAEATASLEPADEYAMITRDRNVQAALPDLGYWGVGEFQWGVSRQSLPAPRAGTLAGLPHDDVVEFDSRGAGLQTVKWVFGVALAPREAAELRTARSSRLAQYQRIKHELVAKYGAPSHPFRPDDNAQDPSKDSYVRGSQTEYAIAWYGPETAVRLSLSDAELAVRFDRQPTSRAGERIAAADRAARIVAERLGRNGAREQSGQ